MTTTLEAVTPHGLLDDQIEPFLQHLRAAGYAERTLRKKRTVARAFARWVKQKRIAMDDLKGGHVAEFVSRSPRRRKSQMKSEFAAMQLYLDFLAAEAGFQCLSRQESVSASGGLLRRYEDYLRKDRGLAENSVHVYVPFIANFLAAQANQKGCVSPDSFDTFTIQNFLLAQTLHRSGEYARLLATALRSFFRFLCLLE